MLITSANEQTKKLTSEQVKLLRDECDDVTARMEAGWLIVISYKGDKRLVLAHCNSQEEYDISMGIYRPNNHWDSYGDNGVGYAFSATATYERQGGVVETDTLYFCHDEQYFSSISGMAKELAEGTFRDATEQETRKITFKAIYWDKIPRSAQVVTLE